MGKGSHHKASDYSKVGKKKKPKTIWAWYCHDCSSQNFLPANEVCSNSQYCNHIRCNHCTLEEIQVNSRGPGTSSNIVPHEINRRTESIVTPDPVSLARNLVASDTAIPTIPSNPSRDSGYVSRGIRTNTDQGAFSSTYETGRSISIEQVFTRKFKVDFSDVETAYSDTESLETSAFTTYISEFAAQIHAALPSGYFHSENLPLLDGLLQAFSSRIKYEGDTKFYGNIGYISYRYRTRIIEELRSINEDKNETKKQPPEDSMSLDEKMFRWGLERPPHTAKPDADDGIREDDTEDMIRELPDMKAYRKILLASPAFKWLLFGVAGVSRLETPGHQHGEKQVRRDLLESMKLPKTYSRHLLPTVQVIFDINWDFQRFHLEQAYTECASKVLEKAITFTGYANHVQATTCIGYMRQTWGFEGLELLSILQKVIEAQGPRNSGTDKCETANLSNGTVVEASWNDGNLILQAIGNPYVVAEIGEQLAWISTALSTCESNTGITYRFPTVNLVVKSASRSSGNLIEASCRIGSVKIDIESEVLDEGVGSCWRDMVRNPVVVVGYPIPRRMTSDSGLEVTFDIMTILASTKLAVNFSGRTFIKGLSTMFAVTRVIDNTVWWHLCLNKDKSYISYEDSRMPESEDSNCLLDLTAIHNKCHVVGWSRNVKKMAGSPNTDYKVIRSSGLGQPSSSFAFDKISISGGKFVNVSASCSVGIKDKPLHINFDDDFTTTLRQMRKQYFLFYDVDERRAWLIDGASTTLHLLRKFIEECQEDVDLEDTLLFDQNKFQEADAHKFGGAAAFDVLQKNKELPLWAKSTKVTSERTFKDGHECEVITKHQTELFCVQDQIMQICNILLQISAYIADISRRDGVGSRIRSNPRRQLEGFDFYSLASNERTLLPKVGAIHENGEGWVDFTRALCIPTLFGNGFGHLLQPIGLICQNCQYNALPERDLLAVSVTDLKHIIKVHGNGTRSPYTVVPNIFWHTPDICFEYCNCSRNYQKRNRVQLFLPDGFRNRRTKGFRSPLELFDDGAVLFGHSPKLPLRWRHQNPIPERVATHPDTHEPAILPVDDGISSNYSRSSYNRFGSTGSATPLSLSVRLDSASQASPASDLYLQPNIPLQESNWQESRPSEPCCGQNKPHSVMLDSFLGDDTSGSDEKLPVSQNNQQESNNDYEMSDVPSILDASSSKHTPESVSHSQLGSARRASNYSRLEKS